MIHHFSNLELRQIGFKSYGHDVYVSRKACIYNPNEITLGHHIRIDDFCILSGGKGIRLGNYIHLSAYSALYGGGGIIMDDFSGLSPRSIVFSETDDFSGDSVVGPFLGSELKPKYISEKVILERYSQIGTCSTIMPGVTLGEGSAVGAHSYVNQSCMPWTIYAGVPASMIKARSRNLETKIKSLNLE